MPTIPHSLRLAAGLIGAAILSLPALRAADDAPAGDAFPNYESYIKLSGQAPFVTGDRAAFAARTQTPNIGAAGIEDFVYTKDLSDSTTITGTGRALAGTDDYLANVKVDSANLGSVDVGYKRFRTFYDGVGGFFPLADQFQAFSPESLHVDRSAFWIDAKLTRPNAPVFEVSFRDEIRTGMKDSTEWAAIVSPVAVVVNGAFVGNAAPANTPFVAPNATMLEEHHDILEASLVATGRKTTETLKLTLDTVNNNDQRVYVKYPNSNVIADPTVVVHDDQETRRSTSFRVLNMTETEIGDRLALDTGLTYVHLTNANGGSWITPAYSASANTVFTATTAGGIYGGSRYDDYVGNLFFKWTPNPNWLAEAGFREESSAITSNGGFAVTSLASGATNTASTNVTTANDVAYSHYLEHVATPELSLQYSGINRMMLYGSFDDRVDHGSQHWINPYAAVTTTGAGVVTTAAAPISSVFFQDANQDNRNAKFGANWNASGMFTVRAEVFRKDHVNRFIGANDIIGTASYGGLYVTGYNFTGAAVSVLFKPVPELSLNTRFQPQRGMMSVLGNAVTGGSGDDVTSGKATGQILSESVNWTPHPRIYVQGNLNLAYNCIQTAYPVVVVSATTYIPTPIQNANNNYITGSACCGLVVDKRTNAELQGFWSRADNYNPQVSLGGVPYGAGFLEQSVTAGLKRKLSDKIYGEGKIGYFRRTDDTTGGFTNYRGPLAYVGLTYSL